MPAGRRVLFRQPGYWELYRWRIIGVICLCLAQTALILGLLASHAKRRRAEETARALSGRLLTTQEEERARLAKELHDGLGQNLALLAVELDLVNQRQPGTPDQVRERLRVARRGSRVCRAPPAIPALQAIR